jgi:hypothetical protein
MNQKKLIRCPGAPRHGRGPRRLLPVAAAGLALLWTLGALAGGQARPLPTHVCNPRLGDYNDRQAFIGFDDGSVQWCRAGLSCVKLEGMPVGKATVAAMACEREQFVWVILSDGAVFRCAAATGRKSCEQVPLR